MFGFTADGEDSDQDNPTSASFFDRDDSGQVRAFRNGSLASLSPSEGAFVYTQRFTGTQVDLFRDGVAGTSAASSGPFGDSGTVGLGANSNFGNVSNRLDGALSEVMLFPAAVPDAQLRALEADQIAWLAGGTPTPPGAPTGVTAAAGQGFLDITWSPPPQDGATLPFTYTATATPGGHQCTTSWPEPLVGCSLTGLDPAITYSVTVAATNLDGTGEGSAPVTAVPTGPELLANRGLETGVVAPFWSVPSSDVVTVPRSGAYAVRLPPSWSGMGRDFTGLKPGTSYTFSAWIRAESAGQTGYLYAKEHGNPDVRSSRVTGTDWQYYSTTFTTGPSATEAEIGLWRDSGQGTGTLLVDDLSLVEVPFSGELLFNEGFEHATRYPWSVHPWSTQIVAEGRTGSRSMRLAPATSGFWRDIDNLDPATTYRLTGWARGESAGQSGYFYLRRDADPEVTSPAATATVWEERSVTFRTGPAGTSAEVGVWRGGDALAGSVLVDDVSLVRSDATPHDELVVNPGFESGTADPWSVQSPPAVLGPGRTGSYALALPTGGSWAALDIRGLEPDTEYTLRAWLLGETAGQEGHVYARHYTSGVPRSALLTSTSWDEGTLTFTTAAAETDVQIGFWRDEGLGSGTMLVDDLSLVRVTP